MSTYVFPISRLFARFSKPTTERSTLELSSSSATAGETGITFTFTALDNWGKAKEGISVHVVSDPETSVEITPETGVTNEEGVFTFVVESSDAQTVSVGLLINAGSNEFSLSETIEFTS